MDGCKKRALGVRWASVCLLIAAVFPSAVQAEIFSGPQHGYSVAPQTTEEIPTYHPTPGDDYAGIEACAYCADTTGCCDCCNRRRGFVFGEALFLRATGSDVAHAQQQNGTGGAGTTPFGTIGVVDHNHNTGFRLGGGICCDACSDVLISYTFFEADGEDSIVPPVIGGGGGAVGSLVHHPNASITASVGPVDAYQEIEFQLGEALYRHHWIRNRCGEVNLMLGMQVGHLDQQFEQSGTFAGGSAGVIDTTSDISFDGGGIKIGIDGQRKLKRCFNLYGRLNASALSGQFKSNYRMHNASTAVDLALADWTEDRVVSLVEYELGIGWTSCCGRWHARAGYLFSHWGNVVTTPTFIDAVQADNYTDVGDTITFDGAVARFECNW